MSMILITSNAREVVAELEKIPEAMQKVTAATLTDVAEQVTMASAMNIRRSMIVRSEYTMKSLVTYKAGPTKPIARQNSVAGTKSDYLPIQDAGGVIRARNKKIAVPTNRLRGEGRKKRIPARYRLGNGGVAGSFILNPAEPVKVLTRPGMFIRKGRRIVKIRDLGDSSYTLKATHWHGDAVKKYGNYATMAEFFRRAAYRYLKEYKPK